MNNKQRWLTRTALLLALTLIFQSLRLLIPLPPMLSAFLIGILVNACLMVTVEKVGCGSAMMIGIVVPIMAYFQQMLVLPILIIPVAMGNFIYILLLHGCRTWSSLIRIVMAACSKGAFLYISFYWLLQQIHIPAQMASMLLLVMGWPQIFTAMAGGILGLVVGRRLI